MLFHCYDIDDKGQAYYSGLRVGDMYDKQTILAYEMNGKTLPIEYGAPTSVYVVKRNTAIKWQNILSLLNLSKVLKKLAKGVVATAKIPCSLIGKHRYSDMQNKKKVSSRCIFCTLYHNISSYYKFLGLVASKSP